MTQAQLVATPTARAPKTASRPSKTARGGPAIAVGGDVHAGHTAEKPVRQGLEQDWSSAMITQTWTTDSRRIPRRLEQDWSSAMITQLAICISARTAPPAKRLPIRS